MFCMVLNILTYKLWPLPHQGDTHYFVMTPTIGALKEYGVIKKTNKDPVRHSQLHLIRGPYCYVWYGFNI